MITQSGTTKGSVTGIIGSLSWVVSRLNRSNPMPYRRRWPKRPAMTPLPFLIVEMVWHAPMELPAKERLPVLDG